MTSSENIIRKKEGISLDKKVIREKQNMTYLSWAKIRNSSGTAGSFLKSFSDFEDIKTYYKLSNYDAYRGVIGHECVNEIIVDRLLSILGIEHLEYRLIHADVQVDDSIIDTYLCESKDFKAKGESKIALDAFYQAERLEGEKPLDFCIRMGWERYIYEVLVVDFLILNRDRHGANIEVLRNSKNKTLRLAPLFDHGLALLFQCQESGGFEKEDVMEDKPIQCFVGSKSAKENLSLIPKGKEPKMHALKESDRTILFADLEDIISAELADKIWEMIWKRWNYYEAFCNQR